MNIALESYFEEHAQEVWDRNWMNPDMQTALMNTCPPKLIATILKALREPLKENDQLNAVEEIASPIPEIPLEYDQVLEGGGRFWDDVNGGYLPEDFVLNAGKDFLTSLIEWEIKVAAYEGTSGDKISEAVRVATIMDHVPDAVNQCFHYLFWNCDASVDALKLRIRESSCATPGLFQGSMPMQVGAVRRWRQGQEVYADEGATCLVLLDVDTRYMKAVLAAGKIVTDYLIECGRRFVEQFFRRRVRLRCDGEPTTLAYCVGVKELLPESVVQERTPRQDRQANLLNELSGRSRNKSRYCDFFSEKRTDLSFWRTHVCGRG